MTFHQATWGTRCQPCVQCEFNHDAVDDACPDVCGGETGIWNSGDPLRKPTGAREGGEGGEGGRALEDFKGKGTQSRLRGGEAGGGGGGGGPPPGGELEHRGAPGGDEEEGLGFDPEGEEGGREGAEATRRY